MLLRDEFVVIIFEAYFKKPFKHNASMVQVRRVVSKNEQAPSAPIEGFTGICQLPPLSNVHCSTMHIPIQSIRGYQPCYIKFMEAPDRYLVKIQRKCCKDREKHGENRIEIFFPAQSAFVCMIIIKTGSARFSF